MAAGGAGNVPLHPPSFFEALYSKVEGERTEAIHGIQEELRQLWQENKELKKQLGSMSTSSSSRVRSPRPPPSSSVSAPAFRTSSALLANDLLDVECHLQSKVRVLEEDRQNMAAQVVELQHLLLKTEEKGQREMEEVMLRYKEAMHSVEGEKEKLKAELESCQEKREQEVAEVRVRWEADKEKLRAEVTSLGNQLRALERSYGDLERKMVEERGDWDRQQRALREQQDAKEKEGQAFSQEATNQISALQSELEAKCLRVQQLEAYLGGELPKCGISWREEKRLLQTRSKELEEENRKLTTDLELLNIRLTSISEILALQEGEMTKDMMDAASCRPGERLLSRWREKVFVMLVQEKLHRMEEDRCIHHARKKEKEFVEWRVRMERERDLLSHSMVDRTAELQLSANKAEVLSRQLAISQQTVGTLNMELEQRQEDARGIVAALNILAKDCSHLQTTLNQALTRLASYEDRMMMQTRRLAAVKASLRCQMSRRQPVLRMLLPSVDFGCQTEAPDEVCMHRASFVSLSKDQLVDEVATLTNERDLLARQLEDVVSNFENQIRELEKTNATHVTMLEERLGRLKGEKVVLSEELTSLQQGQHSLENERAELMEKVTRTEAELRNIQTTLSARVEAALLKEQHSRKEETARMEELISVARREHDKAVLQAQQVLLHAEREKERLVQCGELEKAQLREELDTATKRLHSVEAERNLLMTTLRQEGLLKGSSRPAPLRQWLSPKPLSTVGPKEEREDQVDAFRPLSPDMDGFGENSGRQGFVDGVRSQTGHDQLVSGEDVRQALKELHLLSMSLLEMDSN